MPLDQTAQNRPSFRRRIADATLLSLYDYWLAKAGPGVAMARDDLDPAQIPRLLRNLILADVGDGGRAIRYRVVGTDIAAAHGLDYTGMTVEELTSGDTLDFTRRLYGRVVADRVPVYSEGRFQWFEKEYRWTKRLHLPVSRQGGAVDMVLAGQIFEIDQSKSVEQVVPASLEELAADRDTLSSRRG